MKKNIKGSFLSLSPKAKIFEEIQLQQPKWWSLLCNDKELYIDIRKDNYFNVYYYGGSVARIDYANGFVAKTHQKYLGDEKPRGKSKKGTSIFKYDLFDLDELDNEKIENIKNYIKSDYLRHITDENPAEKWIQGKMIMEKSSYIDSEFQFNKDPEIGYLRIDLVELSEGVLSFIELKGIFDSRLRNDLKRNSNIPEIVEQMAKYKLFINKYEAEIYSYYKKLLEIKQTLGLIAKERTLIGLNKNPKLIIADTYCKMTRKREERISDIRKLLENYNIDYEITK
ncbi:MAG: hypothetical protein CVT94_11965 [Bacteroidetes bacterium HGW-Bacteroidetes-11]|jgi:hypothetical protein|nr:MAG: hypothetical protein CVT94_11965 [Bacteroidetes bacterium HGW-Bacteroidetes-11]